MLQGTLEMLILKALSLQPIHGYGVLVRIQQLSNERLQVQQGSLYPALYRLESRGSIRAEWGESESGRKAKFYRLTPAGKRQLKIETEQWNRLSSGVVGVLDAKQRLPDAGSAAAT
jgi:transcriptional regulator